MPVVTCPSCGAKAKAPDAAAGRTLKCPQCGAAVAVPKAAVPPSMPPPAPPPVQPPDAGQAEPSPARKSCPFCGENILAVAKKCKHCGEMLDAPTQGEEAVGNARPRQRPDEEDDGEDDGSAKGREQRRSDREDDQDDERPRRRRDDKDDDQDDEDDRTRPDGPLGRPTTRRQGTKRRLPAKRSKPPAWVWPVSVGAFFILCCGCAGWGASRRDNKIAEANKLFEQGHRTEAVAIYKRYYSSSAPGRTEMIKRIVEYEMEEGLRPQVGREAGTAHLKEAREWMEKSFEDKLEVPYENAGVKFLAAKAKRHWELVKAGPKGSEAKAEEVARTFVKRRLHFPDTADFLDIGAAAGDKEIDESKGLPWVVSGKVQARNAFNVPQTHRFISIVRLDGDTWTDIETALKEDRE